LAAERCVSCALIMTPSLAVPMLSSVHLGAVLCGIEYTMSNMFSQALVPFQDLQHIIGTPAFLLAHAALAFSMSGARITVYAHVLGGARCGPRVRAPFLRQS
jgi:hypothetical protein